MRCTSIGMLPFCSSSRSKVCCPGCKPIAIESAEKYTARIPISATIEPTSKYNVNFIAAYSLRVEPQVAIRMYIGKIDSS